MIIYHDDIGWQFKSYDIKYFEINSGHKYFICATLGL